ncbi:TIR domain-containing protein [Streptomyces sp. ODS28]|uniref:TIR domain-containing protein n=1 Tax=Streptomyces sp. ODS28 TaxID=3136688 RepID=UPI0031E78978
MAAIVVPAAVFVRCDMCWAILRLQDIPMRKVRLSWSWRVFTQPERLLLILTLIGPVAVLVWAVSTPRWALLCYLAGLLLAVQALVTSGACLPVQGGRQLPPEFRTAPGPAARPGWFVAWSAGAGAVVFGAGAWLARAGIDHAVTAARLPPAWRDLSRILLWLEDQIADSVFGPSFFQPYWPLLAAGAGLVAGGGAAFVREWSVRTPQTAELFTEALESGALGPGKGGKVFVCYSRRDADTARELSGLLSERVRKVWIDWEGIEPSEQWRQSIDEAIRTSDALVVLVSRNSLASKYCWAECERAVDLRKRILPVIIDPELASGTTAAMKEQGWARLTRYEFLRATGPAGVGGAAEDIESFVVERYRWTAFHTRLTIQAHEWETGGRQAGMLLRGHELLIAEAWRRGAPHEGAFGSGLTEPQRMFLEASRRAVRRRTAQVRTAATAVTAALAALASLTVSFQDDAEARRREATSHRLAAEADKLSAGEVRRAALLSGAAHAEADTDDARASMLHQLQRFNRVRGVVDAKTPSISEVTLSSTGRLLIIWGEDGTAELWDTVTMRSRGTVAGRPVPSRSLAGSGGGELSADGSTLAMMRGSGTMALVDTRTLRDKAVVDLSVYGVTGAWSETVDLAPDGKTLIVCGTGTVLVWDVEKKKLVRRLHGDHAAGGRRASAVVDLGETGKEDTRLRPLSPGGRVVREPRDGHTVGVSENGSPLINDDGTARLLDTSGRKGWTPHPGVPAGQISSNGRYASLSRPDGKGRYEVWDLRSHERVGRIDTPFHGGREDLKLSDDGRWLAVSDQPANPSGVLEKNSTFRLYDVRSGKLIATAPGAQLALAGRGRLAAAANSRGTVTLWDLGGKGRLISRHKAPKAQKVAVAGTSGSQVTALLGDDRTVRLVRRRDGATLRTIRLNAPGQALALSPRGKLLAVAEVEGRNYDRKFSVEVFRLSDARRLTRLHDPGAGNPTVQVPQMFFSADGGHLFVAENNARSVYQWKTAGWRFIRSFGPDWGTGRTAFASVSPDGRTLAVGGGQMHVQLWDVKTGKRLSRPLPGQVSVAFLADGRLATGAESGGGPAVRLWDARARRQVAASQDEAKRVIGIQRSASGDTLVALLADGRLVLWEAGLKHRTEIDGVTADSMDAVALAPDGSELVTVQKGRLTSVALGPHRWRAALCDIAQRPLTRREWQKVAPGEHYRQVC